MIDYWHNPRCSKSRAGLALLEERRVDVTVRIYLEDAPSEPELKAAQQALNVSAVEMMRTGEKLFRELNLSRTDSEETLIRAMAANPILIERPLAISGGKAVIGRPTERLLDLI